MDSILSQAYQQIKEDDEKRQTLGYQEFDENRRRLLENHNPVIKDTIAYQPYFEGEEYCCIKEPFYFLNEFQDIADRKSACVERFRHWLKSGDERIIEQRIVFKGTPEYWYNSTIKGINLRPGLEMGVGGEGGFDKSKASVVTLADESVHGKIVGSTGAGKSVFINSLLFSLMTEYPPWELTLFLADFKKVELSRYLSGDQKAPHVKAVAATGEVRYVLSLLKYLYECMKSRQELLSRLGMSKLEDLRRDYRIVLPRILFLVDEFQQLFTEATGRESGEIGDILLKITKLGRNVGFHLLFASQEMSGTINSSAFANIRASFALRCTREVSSDILGNSAAADIKERGVVIANNSENHSIENNVWYKVPFVGSETDFFGEFIALQHEAVENCGFVSVHKYYQEDYIPDGHELENVLNRLKGTKSRVLTQKDFDLFVLGESVYFNLKKYDYETLLLEKTLRKNIGIFSTKVEDLSYMCWLLAANFRFGRSSNDGMVHTMLLRNEMVTELFDIIDYLAMDEDNVVFNCSFMEAVVEEYLIRRKILRCLSRYYSEWKNDKLKFLRWAAEEYQLAEEENKWVIDEYERTQCPEWEVFYSIVYDRVQEQEMSEEMQALAEMIHFLIQREKGMQEKDLFPPYIGWIIGADDIGEEEDYKESCKIFEREVLCDSPNVNMFFVICANSEYDDLREHFSNCDYVFASGGNENVYDKLRIEYTKKTDTNQSIDYVIKSIGKTRAFKKFHATEVKQAPMRTEIDFDQLMEGKEWTA